MQETTDRVSIFVIAAHKLPCALNHGLRHAKGEFLTWISANKHMLPEFLNKLVDYLHHHPDMDMVYADADIIGQNNRSS